MIVPSTAQCDLRDDKSKEWTTIMTKEEAHEKMVVRGAYVPGPRVGRM